MKVRALPKFEGLRDLERTASEGKDVYPKAGDVWETTEERAVFLKKHGVVEIVEEDKKTEKEETKEEVEYLSEPEEKEEKSKKTKKKKTSKK